MIYKSKRKIITRKMQDIIAPGSTLATGGFLRIRDEHYKRFGAEKFVAVFMAIAFVILPAFPAFAQFEPGGGGAVETQGSVALQGSEQPSSSGEITNAITNALSELSTSTITTNTPPISVSSTSSLDPTETKEIGSVSSSTPVEVPISSSTVSTMVPTTAPTLSVGGSTVTDVNALRDQIRREVEEEFRAKVATGELQEKIKNDITERIRQGCLEFEDGSYYCIKNNVREMPTSTESRIEVPTVFLSKSENGGNRGVFFKENGVVHQISQGAEDALFPALDLYGSSIIWQALINNTWQIMVYDRTTSSTTALTYMNFNNMNPQIQKDVIVWQGWVDNNWEIFMAQKVKTNSLFATSTNGILGSNSTWNIRRLTQNTWHDMFPRISGGRITWQAYKNEVWQVFMYDTETDVVSQLSAGNEKSENPRFVVMWEKRDASGGMQTYGYDMTSGESLVIGKHEDKMPFSKDIPQAPLQENKAVVSTSSTAGIKNPNEHNSE